MPRPGRRAPKREATPFDDYSYWNINVSKAFILTFIIGALIIVLGIWTTIIGMLIESGKLDIFISFDLSLQFAIIAGTIFGHLVLLIFLFILFKGGRLRMLKVLFKDRKIAKKYEDFSALRLLLAITLLFLYVVIISLIIAIIPGIFFVDFAAVWWAWVLTFNPGQWILYIGAWTLIITFIVFFMFILWNHGVYAVLKRIKKIEDEQEIKDEISKESLQKLNNEELKSLYKKEMGKNAIYRGKETKGFKQWKAKKLN